MTTSGPYTEATLLYEPIGNELSIPVASPNTILYFINLYFPSMFEIIKYANLFRLYNDTANEYSNNPALTLFIPRQCRTTKLSGDGNQRETAIQLCKASTTKGALSRKTLASSECMILKSLSPSNDIIVETNHIWTAHDGTVANTSVNGSLIVEDIKCTNGIIYILNNEIW